MSKLHGRTISALKNAGINDPQNQTIRQLLAVPNLGIKGVTDIAQRIYARSPLTWPEFEPKPAPEPRCSHRYKISERCDKCIADAKIREERL